jgi:MFS family permease
LSPVAPIAYSLAARSAPGRVGQAASAVTVFGYSAFLLVPVVVGAVAEASSIRTAFRLLFLTGLGILVLSRLVSQEEP